MAELRRLDLGYSERMAALPAGLCALAGLEELDLQDCGLTSLPEGIGGLIGLWKLDLCGNRGLAALPAGLGELHDLKELGRGICPRLATLDALKEREGLPALHTHMRGSLHGQIVHSMH
jgi:Leucine-rich repeat (LRR) protein